MAEYSLPYGTGSVSFNLPDHRSIDLITPRLIAGVQEPIRTVENALSQPLGGFSFDQIRPLRSAAIAINDKTRPVPHEILLPPILAKLEQLGLSPTAITLIIATGTHTPMQPAEYRRILPEEILSRYPVVSHNCDDLSELIDLGSTRQGTPVQINRRFMQADLRIVVGNIEPHHFMGFSGGVKSASIGLGSRETISRNHAMLAHPYARTAEYERNPMRQDIEEIGQLIGVHLAVNAIMNPNKQIVAVVAGEPRAVMQAGIPLCQSVCQVQIPHPYDLVIASAGGQPKDINFYQAQKALTHASMITRDGGTVILAAACPEGVGSSLYEQYMENVHSHYQVIERFKREGFRVGYHKAFQVARDAVRVRVILVSSLSPILVQRLLLESSPSVSEAIDQVLVNSQAPLQIAVLPRAVTTIPLLAG